MFEDEDENDDHKRQMFFNKNFEVFKFEKKTEKQVEYFFKKVE